MPPKRKNTSARAADAPKRSAPTRSAKTQAVARTTAMYEDPFLHRLPSDDDIFDSSADELTEEEEEDEQGDDVVERTPTPPLSSRNTLSSSSRKGARAKSKATPVVAATASTVKLARKAGFAQDTPTNTLRQAGTLKFATVSSPGSTGGGSAGKSPAPPPSSSSTTFIPGASFVSELEDAGHWTGKYAPIDISEVAVHAGKIKDVREWLEKHTIHGHSSETGGSVLLLTGPAGSGKTTVLRMLAKELDLEIVEWVNTMNPNTLIQRPKVLGERTARAQTIDEEYVPVMEAFQRFFARASRFDPLALDSGGDQPALTGQSRLMPRKRRTRKNIMLLEDFPPISASSSRQIFQETITRFTRTERTSSVLVMIISDVFSKNNTEMLFSSTDYQEPALTARTMLPKSILDYSHKCQEIKFNPIAKTIMMKAVRRIIKEEFKTPASRLRRPTDGELEQLYSLHNGDIRGMLNTLQFYCILPTKKRRHQTGGEAGHNDAAERDSSLGLFHAAGKVLYNKRDWYSFVPHGDTRLPFHLRWMSRPPLPFNPEIELMDKLPVDPDLFSLMLHQNYPHHQTSISECSLAADYLSVSDIFSQRAGLENIHMTPYSTSIAIRGVLIAPKGPGRVPQDRKQWWPELLGVNRSKRETEQTFNDFAACLLGETAEGFATGFINGPGVLPKSLLRHEIAPALAIMYKSNPYHAFFRHFPVGKRQFLKNEVGVYGLGKGIQKRKVGEHETGLEDQVVEAAAASSQTEIENGGESSAAPATTVPSSKFNNSSKPAFLRSTTKPLQFTSTMMVGEEDPIEDFSD